MYLRDQNFNVEKGKYYLLKINKLKYSPDLESRFTKTIYVGTGEGKIDANKFKAELKGYIESIKSANFAASPTEECEYCEFYDICEYFLRGVNNEVK
jgi:hypothetical protein